MDDTFTYMKLCGEAEMEAEVEASDGFPSFSVEIPE